MRYPSEDVQWIDIYLAWSSVGKPELYITDMGDISRQIYLIMSCLIRSRLASMDAALQSKNLLLL